MMVARTTLPELEALDFAALKALIVAQHEQLVSKDQQLASRDEEVKRTRQSKHTVDECSEVMKWAGCAFWTRPSG